MSQALELNETRLVVRIPHEWKEKLKKKAKEKGYFNISELVRDLLREYLESDD